VMGSKDPLRAHWGIVHKEVVLGHPAMLQWPSQK
jgi:hypothetical protein